MRNYGFSAQDITRLRFSVRASRSRHRSRRRAGRLIHRERFPVDVNSASREMLLRVPGLGVRVVDRIIASRRQAKLRYADLSATRRQPAQKPGTSSSPRTITRRPITAVRSFARCWPRVLPGSRQRATVAVLDW